MVDFINMCTVADVAIGQLGRPEPPPSGGSGWFIFQIWSIYRRSVAWALFRFGPCTTGCFPGFAREVYYCGFFSDDWFFMRLCASNMRRMIVTVVVADVATGQLGQPEPPPPGGSGWFIFQIWSIYRRSVAWALFRFGPSTATSCFSGFAREVLFV
ncbi:Hypothetical predicted protein [Olea europaea subsp. europaea]|uniref:Uncharacterized protein n=1 Tax=Olea europaea subsp. europaea TaxID=158383 RepID=A0A8S0UL87_OLEEU|nr:Hypothetical predicted protein [Olea europaea subsp. europaea]